MVKIKFCDKSAFVILAFCVCSLLFFARANALTEIESASSLNPVGSGARATGMGGAFIGVADDATAASWNPAGLIQLEQPEVSVVYSLFHRKQNFWNEGLNDFDHENSMDTEGLNYASIAYPFVLFNRNMIISLNYQRLFEMHKDVDYGFGISFFSGETAESRNNFTQEGYLYTLSPAIAVQIIPELYVGATLNFWDDYFGRNGWERTETQKVTGTLFAMPFEELSVTRDKVDFEGINAHLGFMWNLTPSLTLGGVYKTAFDADLAKKTTRSGYELLFGINTPAPPETTSKDLELRMPASYGLGLAYRHYDNLTLALDVYITDWSKFVLEGSDGKEANPATGFAISEGRLKDTTQVRLGSEYLFVKGKNVIPLRFGIFYDPEPQTGHLDEYYGFSVGSGLARGSVVFDVAYQFRTGNDLTGSLYAIEGTSVDIKQHSALVSLILYF